MRSQLMCLARLLMGHTNGKDFRNTLLFRKQLSSEESGALTRAENMLDLVPPPGTISHLTRDIQKVSHPKSSFARSWK